MPSNEVVKRDEKSDVNKDNVSFCFFSNPVSERCFFSFSADLRHVPWRVKFERTKIPSQKKGSSVKTPLFVSRNYPAPLES